MFRLKRDFIAANKLSLFRFHDQLHGHKPDGIIDGMAVGLGWKKYQNPDNPTLVRSSGDRAQCAGDPDPRSTQDSCHSRSRRPAGEGEPRGI
jgi:hypothetical protein